MMDMIYDNIYKAWAIKQMRISFVQCNPLGSVMAQPWDLLLYYVKIVVQYFNSTLFLYLLLYIIIKYFIVNYFKKLFIFKWKISYLFMV